MENPSSMSTSTAFTTVPARRAFTRPSMTTNSIITVPQNLGATPPSTTSHEKTKREWPDCVRQYVSRAFAVENKMAGIKLEDMQDKLKKIISDAVESNTLYTADWSKLPLPQHMIVNERAAAAFPPPWQQTQMELETNHRVTTSSPKKRKSGDLEGPHPVTEKAHPWQQAKTHSVFEDRISFPDKRQRYDIHGKSSKSDAKLDHRKKRFDNYQSSTQTYGRPLSPPHATQGPVVGRCQDLEKKYFRLTSAPNPDTVRPLPVLQKTLDLLKRKWKQEGNYSYICDQFKSLRQDLTVQHIKTDFTVNVYEIHARIALEKGDLGEYNQCQTQLRALYSQNLGGHPEEFKAYRILYFIHTCNRPDMNDVLASLTETEKKHRSIKHALDTRSALALGNYHRFFKLYLDTPSMGAYLMDMFVGRERLAALSRICTSYKQAVSLRFITEELGFETDEESARFICGYNGQEFLAADDGGGVKLLTGKAVRFFEPAKIEAFRTVDIKGQI